MSCRNDGKGGILCQTVITNLATKRVALERKIHMKLKKLNALLGLLSILAMLLHMGYTIVAYLMFYYNPFLKTVFAVPFMVLVCLHAVCGMVTVFLQADGTRLDLYPKQNLRTILQRVSAALILPLLILHINTFSMMKAASEGGQMIVVLLLIVAELLFFATALTHVATSLTKGFITLGLLSSPDMQKKLDVVIYVILAIAFVVAAYAVVSTQVKMFL